MELFSTPEEFLHDDVEEPGEALPETVVLAAFRDDLARLAEKILLRFFVGKTLREGGPVTKELLCTPENVELMIDGEFGDRVDQIYQELGTLGVDEPTGVVTWDIRYVLSKLEECKNLGIPKPLAAGVVLIYTRLCQNLDGLRVA